MKRASIDAVQRLGMDLGALCARRKKADYKMERVLSVDAAQDAIEEADAYLELLSKIPKEYIGKAMDDFQASLP
ncbi:MAG: hypothetical protein V3W31_05420 [Thermodesulfobacteriota bacterium]